MRKMLILLFLTVILSLSGLSSGQSAAAALPKNNVYMDKSNHSYIPLRFLTGFGGIQTEWNAATKEIKISLADVSVTLTVGQATASVNGKPVTISERAFSENGTTYVPLSLICHSLGIMLTWNTDSSSLTLTKGEDNSTLPVLSGSLLKADSPAVVSANRTFKIGSRSFNVQTVTISLLHPTISLDVVLAGNTVGKVETLGSLAKRSSAIAAINGTFFNAYTQEDYKAPYGYIVSGGKLLMNSSGDRRTIFTIDNNNLAELIPGLDFNNRFATGSIKTSLQAGPRLLVNGKVALNVAAEGFKDAKILTGGGARSALGLTRDHKLILLTSGGATIPQLAEIMKQAGAYQAMNLDGGASSGLYYNGKYLTAPGRLISNAIVVKE
ncbi:phosphodiester glycosidase family protein [Paenibacillus sp. 19GGS1-52]|uniref:phosphodiester glycosidase family protein n=1 Tax=Paenibacillus sp. 19GGS1-52 TaxID=2758563 RepID=UPI001EFAEB5A|nr:phosphodiester glycosidase family protein [Paenibacillus sp. 19GGS1-52]ULO06577.1 phosphodiester glycosidase family protein [Paenibacillus sp. 19GGS1-52]